MCSLNLSLNCVKNCYISDISVVQKWILSRLKLTKDVVTVTRIRATFSQAKENKQCSCK